jgi:hypothetical protein
MFKLQVLSNSIKIKTGRKFLKLYKITDSTPAIVPYVAETKNGDNPEGQNDSGEYLSLSC